MSRDVHIFVRNFSVGLKISGNGEGWGRSEHVPRVVYETLKWLQMLTGGPNYIMIRRGIFGKVHGHGVKEICLISQFPAKHNGVASGPKIVFARPGLARLLG